MIRALKRTGFSGCRSLIQLRGRPLSFKNRPHTLQQSTRSFIPKNRFPEVVLLGPGAEISSVGTEQQKIQRVRHGRLRPEDKMLLLTRMQVLRNEDSGAVFETQRLKDDGRLEALSSPAPVTDLSRVLAKWSAWLENNTGIRSLTPDNVEFDPEKYTSRAKEPRKLGPLPVDFAAPIPTHWNWNFLSGSQPFRKFLGKSNQAINLAHEGVLRALLNAGLHSHLTPLSKHFNLDRVGLHLGTGIGPLPELVKIVELTESNGRIGPKFLPHSLANIPHGYITTLLGIGGEQDAHVGACESLVGAIAHGFRAIKHGYLDLVIGGGYETPITAMSLYGFVACQALITNESLIARAQEMTKAGILPRGVYEPIFEGIRRKGNPYQLPKALTRIASMPMTKYRGGFVEAAGAAAIPFGRMDAALEHGYEITATIAGCAPGVPDSPQDDEPSIAALGDGSRKAIVRAIHEVRENYSDFGIHDEIAVYMHGTSTPLNGFGERENIQLAFQELGRQLDNPVLLFGDKGLQGHRIGANGFSALVADIFANQSIPASPNYFTPGYEKDALSASLRPSDSLGPLLDDQFPMTKVVDQETPFKGKWIVVIGAGFGRINSVIILRRFDPELGELDIDSVKKLAYKRKRAIRLAEIPKVRKQIDLGLLPYLEN